MKSKLLLFFFLFTILFTAGASAQVKIIQTYAGIGGTGAFGGDGGPATGAQFNAQYLTAMDAAGNLYIADNANARVRKIDPTTGIITTVVGGGATFGDGGPATAAQLGGTGGGGVGVVGVAIDPGANFLYVADGTNNRIRLVTMATGIITTLCGTGSAGFSPDGTAASVCQVSGPRGMAVDGAFNLYFSDAGNQRVRMISSSTLQVTTIAGNGTAGYLADGVAASTTRVNNVRGMTVDASGNLFIADMSNSRIRRIDAATNIITTVAGNGSAGYTSDGVAATSTRINLPTDVKFDAAGNMYIADVSNNRVRMVDPSGTITTIAGSGTGGFAGDGSTATAAAVRLSSPVSVAVQPGGRFYYISDRNNNRIRIVRPNSAPYFTGPSVQSLTVCENSSATSINSLMPVMDSDRSQIITWSVNTAALHGTVLGTATVTSTTAVVTPGGLSYTPNVGYSGSDFFIMQVSDGFSTAFDTITVTVNPLPVVAPVTGPSAVCVGAVITLDDVTPGGTWSASNSNASIAGGTIVGNVAGIDTISYTVTNSCGPTTVTVAITVSALPAPITGIPTVCVGATTTLADGGGGSWTSGAPATASVGALTGIVSGLSAGTATITYTVSGGCYVTQDVTVNSSPAAITPAGAVSLCAGATSSLGDGTPGGTWSSGSPSIATVGGTGTVTGIAPGAAVISYTNGSGCSATKTVTVLTTPAALAPSSATICAGSNVTFTESVPGGVWSSVAPGTASVAAGVVTGVAAGSTSISYTIGTCAVGAPVVVNSTPSAITPAGGVSICVGATASLSDGTPGGSWSSAAPGIASVGGTGIVAGVAAGAANISYTNGFGCAAVKTVTVLTTPSAIAPTSATVCTGSTVTLTETVPGGVWTSTAPGTAGVAGGIVTGVAVGTASISYTIGTCAVGIPVTVNPSPDAGTIVGPSVMCQGTTVPYTDAAPGGTWSTSNPSIATVSGTGSVTGVAGGSVLLSYTFSNSCGTAIATQPITVNSAASAGTIIGTTLVCAGGMTTYVDTTAGGTWSVTNGNATISGTGTLFALTPGTDTVLYSISNTCGSVSSMKIVTIGLPLSAGAIVGPSSVCTGATITLLDGATGGVWSSSNSNATVSGGVVTGVSGGTATISYTVTSGCGSISATHPVTVVPTPAPGTITGPTIVCAGTITTYTDASPGGVWGVTNTLGAISGGGIFTPVTPGTDTITYTITNSCGTAAASLAVSIGSALTAGTISGPGVVCSGSAITLTDPVAGGTWGATNGHATVIAGVVTGVSAGIDTILYTVTGSCGSVSATAAILVNPLPVAGTVSGPSTLCIGLPATYTDAAPGGTWSMSNTHAAISSGGVATPLSTGGDTVMYIVSNTCGTATATQAVTILGALSAGTITGPSGVCVGASITLTDAAPGGAWSASNTSASVAGGIVTGMTTGIDTISYTVTGTCGSVAATRIVIVDVTPSAGVITGGSSVCLGSPVLLTDGASGGAWSASNPSATVSVSGLVTAVTPGTDTISYTVTNGCGSAAATQVMLVSTALPSAGIITGPSSVCAGSTMTLTDATPGGVWSSSNATATVAGGVVTGVTPGTDTINYVVTNACGSSTAEAPITVGAALVTGTISGPSAVCTGASVTLTDAAPGGVWGSSNGNATVSGGVVTGLTPGTDTISYTVSGTCGTAAATAVITISVAPDAGAISGPTGVCAGASVTLTDAAPGGAWSASNTRASVSTGGLVTGVLAGLDTIRYTVTNACGSAVASRPIAINSAPGAGTIGGASSICPAGTATLSHSASGGSWSSSNVGVATVSSAGIVTGVSSGAATISYTLSNGCGHSSATHGVTVLPLSSCGTAVNGPGTQSGDELLIAPNPSNGRFTLTLNSANDEIVRIVITNLIGQKVKEFTGTTNKIMDVELTTGSGIYMINAITTTGRHVVKMTVN